MYIYIYFFLLCAYIYIYTCVYTYDLCTVLRRFGLTAIPATCFAKDIHESLAVNASSIFEWAHAQLQPSNAFKPSNLFARFLCQFPGRYNSTLTSICPCFGRSSCASLSRRVRRPSSSKKGAGFNGSKRLPRATIYESCLR